MSALMKSFMKSQRRLPVYVNDRRIKNLYLIVYQQLNDDDGRFEDAVDLYGVDIYYQLGVKTIRRIAVEIDRILIYG